MRPEKPLSLKLARALQLTESELEDRLARSANVAEPCWFGARKVFHNGRPRSTLRLLLEMTTGQELGSDQRLRKRLCPNPGCLNPAHYQPTAYQTWQQRFCSPPPVVDVAALIVAAHDLESQAEDDFRDVLDLIESGDGGRNRSAVDLQSQWPMYELELFERALVQLNSHEA